MKFICYSCNAEFDESDANKQAKSLLVRWMSISCPYCNSPFNIGLTEKDKTLVDRKAKIKKIFRNQKDYFL